MIEKMSDKTKKYLVYGMVAFVTILFISSYIVGKKEEKKQEVQQEVDAKIKAEKYKKEQYENNYQTEEEIIQQKKKQLQKLHLNLITKRATLKNTENQAFHKQKIFLKKP